MNVSYLNGTFLPKEDIRISPDDRGFLFGDGIYEVMKWYGGFFYDHESHLIRLKRSLRETRINCKEADSFLSFSEELIKKNGLSDKQALLYLQITRGAAPRSHSFPDPEVTPTVYAFAREINSVAKAPDKGISIMFKDDIRWSRCDIKSVALLANTLSFQEACEKGFGECIFVRNGVITEGSRSNIFFVSDGVLYTHPESQFILSGVTRKNMIRIAKNEGIEVREEAFSLANIKSVTEAFITNTSAELSPVGAFGSEKVGDGMAGPVSRLILDSFNAEIKSKNP